MRVALSALSLASRAFAQSSSAILTRPSSTANFSAIKAMAPSVIRRAFSSGNPVVFSIETVEDFTQHVVNSETPVVVDFYADWCGPCKLLGPRLEEKVVNRSGALFMAKVNVDLAGELAAEFDISAVPTVLAFKDGECVAELKGNVSDEELDSFIEQAVEE